MVSSLLKGLEWVARHHEPPAVVHMSVEGGYSSVINAAVERLARTRGLHVVASSGNSARDACRASPASAPAALTVAAVDSNLQRWAFANWGACVDVFAPGVSILSAVPDSDASVGTKTGTSMAARERARETHAAGRGVWFGWIAVDPSLLHQTQLQKRSLLPSIHTYKRARSLCHRCRRALPRAPPGERAGRRAAARTSHCHPPSPPPPCFIANPILTFPLPTSCSLLLHQGASPQEVAQRLYASALSGAIRDDPLGYGTLFPGRSPDLPDLSATPNRLLQSHLAERARLEPGALRVAPGDAGARRVALRLAGAPRAAVSVRVTVAAAWDGAPLADVSPGSVTILPASPPPTTPTAATASDGGNGDSAAGTQGATGAAAAEAEAPAGAVFTVTPRAVSGGDYYIQFDLQ